MADVKDPKIAEGKSELTLSNCCRLYLRYTSQYSSLINCDWSSGLEAQSLTCIAYEKVRDHKDDTTWLLLDYEVGQFQLGLPFFRSI